MMPLKFPKIPKYTKIHVYSGVQVANKPRIAVGRALDAPMVGPDNIFLTAFIESFSAPPDSQTRYTLLVYNKVRKPTFHCRTFSLLFATSAW